MKIVPVTTVRLRRRFVAFPYKLHQADPHWIGPLRRDQHALLTARRNCFFLSGEMQPFVAIDEQANVVGRVAAIHNRLHVDHHRDERGFFGFFDAIDDQGIVDALMARVERWVTERGLQSIFGPVNPTLHETAGVLVQGFDRAPSVMMPHNPPYYAERLRGAGFTPVMALWSYYLDWRHANWRRLERGEAIMRRRHPDVRIRPVELSRFKTEADVIFNLYNRAFVDTTGFVPITKLEFEQMAGSMRAIMDPALVLIAERGDQPVGFVLALPNVNRLLRYLRSGRFGPVSGMKLMLRARLSPPEDFRTILLGVVPELRKSGLDMALIVELIRSGRRNGYRASELGWVMDDNAVLKNGLNAIGAIEEKEFVLFEKVIETS